jgi:hypothetical protein
MTPDTDPQPPSQVGFTGSTPNGRFAKTAETYPSCELIQVGEPN